VKNEIISNLDFTDLRVYIDHIKSKQTKHTNKVLQGAQSFLKSYILIFVVFIDILFFGGESYFITIIDDFSQYGCIYLLHAKPQSVNVFEMYIKRLRGN